MNRQRSAAMVAPAPRGRRGTLRRSATIVASPPRGRSRTRITTPFGPAFDGERAFAANCQIRQERRSSSLVEDHHMLLRAILTAGVVFSGSLPDTYGQTTIPPGTGFGITAQPGGPFFYSKSTETTKLNPLTTRHCFTDGFKKGVYDKFNIPLVQVRIFLCEFGNEF